MKNSRQPEIVVTGLGVTSAIGQGKSDFIANLLDGQHRFGVMQRPGRQASNGSLGSDSPTTQFLGAEIAELVMPACIPAGALRTASLSARVAIATLHEAWNEARLNDLDPTRLGLIIGGSNFQQREIVQTHESYKGRSQFLRPTYGMSFMDSDLCGLCSELFGVHGLAYTVGGASASGQLAVLQAIQAVRSGQVDVCIAMGALMDLSFWECTGLRSIGAMGTDRYASDPELACRPFDRDRDGFIFGESCGALIIESQDSASRRGVDSYARLSGGAISMDGNRNPNPSLNGEIRAIKEALQQAGLASNQIDYINPHGTGSSIGDEIELQALKDCSLTEANINATKSIIGHGLTAAGSVEIVAILLQMQKGQLHPTRNLENPMDTSFNWVGGKSRPHSIRNALNLSMGFGGINTAVCIQQT